MDYNKFLELSSVTSAIEKCLYAGIEMVDFENKIIRMNDTAFDMAFPGVSWTERDGHERKITEEFGVLFYCEKGKQ